MKHLKEAKFVRKEMLSVTGCHIICHIVIRLSIDADQQITLATSSFCVAVDNNGLGYV